MSRDCTLLEEGAGLWANLLGLDQRNWKAEKGSEMTSSGKTIDRFVNDLSRFDINPDEDAWFEIQKGRNEIAEWPRFKYNASYRKTFCGIQLSFWEVTTRWVNRKLINVKFKQQDGRDSSQSVRVSLGQMSRWLWIATQIKFTPNDGGVVPVPQMEWGHQVPFLWQQLSVKSFISGWSLSWFSLAWPCPQHQHRKFLSNSAGSLPLLLLLLLTFCVLASLPVQSQRNDHLQHVAAQW